MMIEVLCEELVEEVLIHPQEYIDDSRDVILLKIHNERYIDNPLLIMVGQDEQGKYYLVMEDNDMSEDFYPNDEETLLDLYVKMLKEIAAYYKTND